MDLINSKRILRSASYVSVELTPDERQQAERGANRGIEKSNFIRELKITPETVARATEVLSNQPEFERGWRDSLVALRDVSEMMFGERPQSNLAVAGRAATIPADLLTEVAAVMDLSGAMFWQVQAFQQQMKIAPVGRLHLERIEMYPIGLQRGEIVFTVPMAPKETVTISHKEWSTSGEEYERIVQDYFESYSERGVAEKTDVSMSIENEAKHASAFNFAATASGGYGPVAMTVAFGMNQSSEDRQATRQSAQRTREVTEKASARTRQEHKVSIKLETKRGVEDSSFRTIANAEDKAVRVDYYRLMRKWRTDLYRYGLRLTFDIAVPNPGARLWALYRKVRELDIQIREPFAFSLTPDDLITTVDWQTEAAKYGVVLETPPSMTVPVAMSRTLRNADPSGSIEIFDFVAPPGFRMDPSTLIANGLWRSLDLASPIPVTSPLLLCPPNTTVTYAPIPGTAQGTIQLKSYGFGDGTQSTWFLGYSKADHLVLSLRMDAMRTEPAMLAWATKSWTTLRDAAFATWQADNARLQAERDRLWSDLAGKDTLTLRRLEREELIRETLYWMVGAHFDPTPGEVGKVVQKLVTMEEEQLPDDWPGADMFRLLSESEWATASWFGEVVKFIHQAVEWENLLYFLYPYFWGSDDVAREKMLFEHPDPTHREFLRAGYARVVVPIRPGFEAGFTQLLNTGVFGGTGGAPYLTIAEEIAAFAHTNYAGIPPANPEKHARPLLYPQQRTTWEIMQKVIKLIEDYHQVHDAYPADLSVLPGAPFRDAWGEDLVYRNPGTGNDYDLVSLGADGEAGGEGVDADISAGAGASLMASWFDYTPTSGLDITIDADLDDVA